MTPQTTRPFFVTLGLSALGLFGMRVAASLLLAAAPAAWGDGLFDKNAQDYFSPTHTLELEAGISNQKNPNGDRNTYHRLSYRGSLLDAAGTPFKYAQSLSLLAPKTDTAPSPGHDLTFTYEGGGQLAATLLSATQAFPLRLRGFDDVLRGSAFLGGNLQNKTYQAAIGVETPPFHVAAWQSAQVSHWLVLGLHGQHQEATDTDQTDGRMALLTYRAFVGKTFGWSQCAQPTEIQDRVTQVILSQAPSYAEALAVEERILRIAPDQRTRVQEVFYDAVDDVRTKTRNANNDRALQNQEWQSTVKKLVWGDVKAFTECPTVAAYAEWSGWFTLAGIYPGRRNKGLLSTTVDYWPLKNDDNVLLRLRYENGFERAAPTVKKKQTTLSVVLRY